MQRERRGREELERANTVCVRKREREACRLLAGVFELGAARGPGVGALLMGGMLVPLLEKICAQKCTATDHVRYVASIGAVICAGMDNAGNSQLRTYHPTTNRLGHDSNTYDIGCPKLLGWACQCQLGRTDM